jgi:hypothetical protein
MFVNFLMLSQQKKDLQYLGQYRQLPKGFSISKIEEDPRTVILGLYQRYQLRFEQTPAAFPSIILLISTNTFNQ